MPAQFEPKLAALPVAQREIWPLLAPTSRLGFVLYGGTAIALHLGHRVSVDFDFFTSAMLKKSELTGSLAFMLDAETIQEDENTLVLMVRMPSGSVKVSFFGGLAFGRINDPVRTNDSVLLVASLEDLLATKLKAILDRAEAKDYQDIAAMLSAAVSLERGLGAFGAMFKKDPGLPLRALGFFKDGDLPSLPETQQDILRAARDRVSSVPSIALEYGSLCGQV